jgi:hypothetical protein
MSENSMNNQSDQLKKDYPELAFMDGIATIMDNAIPIPFTNRRFGLDALVGLIPTVGDLLSLGISGLLILTILRHGVSFTVLLKMIWNIILDASVGSIPIIGDFFDFSFKANRRNVALLKADYAKGGRRMNAWLAAFILLCIVVAMMLLIFYYAVKLIGILWNFIVQQF